MDLQAGDLGPRVLGMEEFGEQDQRPAPLGVRRVTWLSECFSI